MLNKFDYTTAKKDGWSDDQIAQFLEEQQSSGTTLTIDQEEIESYNKERLRQPINFARRMKLSFGGEKANIERATLDPKGLDLGDIADVAGKALPFVGSLLGAKLGLGIGLAAGASLGLAAPVVGAAGAAVGGAGGAALGEKARQEIGERLGTFEEGDPSEVGREAVLGAAGEIGGRVIAGGLKYAGKFLFKDLPLKIMQKIALKQTPSVLRQEIKTAAPKLVEKEGKIVAEEASHPRILAKDILESDMLGKLGGRTREGLRKVAQEQMVTSENAIKGISEEIDDVVSLRDTVSELESLATKMEDIPGASSKSGAKQIRTVASDIAKKEQDLSIDEAIKLKRVLDNAAYKGTENLTPELAAESLAQKTAADSLRKKLYSQFPELAREFKEEEVALRTIKSLDRAEGLGGYSVGNLYDWLALSAGESMGEGATMAVVRRTLGAMPVVTFTAKNLTRMGKWFPVIDRAMDMFPGAKKVSSRLLLRAIMETISDDEYASQ